MKNKRELRITDLEIILTQHDFREEVNKIKKESNGRYNYYLRLRELYDKHGPFYLKK